MINTNDIPYVKALFERFDKLSNEQHKGPKFLNEYTKDQRALEIQFRMNKLNQELYSWADAAITTQDILTRLQYGSIHFINNGRQFPVWGTTHDRTYK